MSRSYIKSNIDKLPRFFNWAVSEQLVPVDAEQLAGDRCFALYIMQPEIETRKSVPAKWKSRPGCVTIEWHELNDLLRTRDIVSEGGTAGSGVARALQTKGHTSCDSFVPASWFGQLR